MADLSISPEEIRGALDSFMESYRPADVATEEVGHVIETADGIAHVEGLPGTMANELLRFEDGTLGLAMNLDQREIGADVDSFAGSLRAALREDPDVILVGEMRDFETINAAVTAAETGHLVLSTLHTTGAAETIDRIIDVYPPHSQGQIRAQLANSLVAVISQTLVPTADGKGRIAALELMSCTDAIGSLIREGKIFQIPNSIQTSKALGMFSLDQDLARLVRTGKITEEVARSRCQNPDDLKRYIGAY